MILNVEHSTIYAYQQPLQRSAQLLRLTPLTHQRQRVLTWQLQTSGELTSALDWYGNQIHYLMVSATCNITLKALGQVEVRPAMANPLPGPLPVLYFLRYTELANMDSNMRQWLMTVNAKVSAIAEYTRERQLELLALIAAAILFRVPYQRGITSAITSASAAFALGAGVCQDHTHIFLACCRCLQLPARYVSGYLHTDDVSHLASHAWAEVWLTDGWYSFDISNQCPAGEQHIELAYGLDYLDAGPIRGSRFGGGEECLNVISLVTDQ